MDYGRLLACRWRIYCTVMIERVEVFRGSNLTIISRSRRLTQITEIFWSITEHGDVWKVDVYRATLSPSHM